MVRPFGDAVVCIDTIWCRHRFDDHLSNLMSARLGGGIREIIVEDIDMDGELSMRGYDSPDLPENRPVSS